VEAWIKPEGITRRYRGHADFWERRGVFSGIGHFQHGFQILFGGLISQGQFPGRVQSVVCSEHFFGLEYPQFGVKTPLPIHAKPAHISVLQEPYAINPNAYPGAPGIIGPIRSRE